MVANSIQDIYNEFKNEIEYSPDSMLSFFSENSLTFDGFRNFKENELHYYIIMVAQYLHALYEKARFNEAIDASIKYLQIIDNEIERLHASVKDDWYYNIFLFKGMASYRLRNYKLSTSIFKKLAQHDPKNENYENWLKFSKYFQRKWILNIISIGCIFIALFLLFFDKYISTFLINILLATIALTGLIGTEIYDLIIRKSFRKKSASKII